MPLKDGLNTLLFLFKGCHDLNHVDLAEEALLHELTAALHLENWKNDIKEEIDSINRILPETPAGDVDDEFAISPKARAIKRWIRSLLSKLVHYKAEHQRLLGEMETSLQLALPREIVMNNIIPFLELPPHKLTVWRSRRSSYLGDEDYWQFLPCWFWWSTTNRLRTSPSHMAFSRFSKAFSLSSILSQLTWEYLTIIGGSFNGYPLGIIGAYDTVLKSIVCPPVAISTSKLRAKLYIDSYVDLVLTWILLFKNEHDICTILHNNFIACSSSMKGARVKHFSW